MTNKFALAKIKRELPFRSPRPRLRPPVIRLPFCRNSGSKITYKLNKPELTRKGGFARPRLKCLRLKLISHSRRQRISSRYLIRKPIRSSPRRAPSRNAKEKKQRPPLRSTPPRSQPLSDASKLLAAH